jgi:hypothetical protein
MPDSLEGCTGRGAKPAELDGTCHGQAEEAIAQEFGLRTREDRPNGLAKGSGEFDRECSPRSGAGIGQVQPITCKGEQVAVRLDVARDVNWLAFTSNLGIGWREALVWSRHCAETSDSERGGADALPGREAISMALTR